MAFPLLALFQRKLSAEIAGWHGRTSALPNGTLIYKAIGQPLDNGY